MSNQFESLMPRIISRGILKFRETAILPRLVNNSMSAEAAQRGDAIKVPISQPVTVSDVTPSHQPPAPPDTSMHSVTVPLANWKRAAFHLTDAEMLQIESQSHFIPLQMAEAITALAGAVNASILDLHSQIPNSIGTPAKLPFQLPGDSNDADDAWVGVNAAIAARKALNKAVAPKSGRFAVIDYDMEANALGLPQFHDASKAGSNTVPMDGEIGRKFGIDWYASDLLPKPRVTVTGVTTVGEAAANATQIKLNKPPAALRLGAVFTLAAITGKFHHITRIDSVADNADHSLVTLADSLTRTVPGNNAVTFANDVRIGLVMHRDAVALAMRPLTMGGLETGASGHIMGVTDPQTGLSLRLEVTRQYKQTVWEFDVLWGAALVRPELAVKLYG